MCGANTRYMLKVQTHFDRITLGGCSKLVAMKAYAGGACDKTELKEIHSLLDEANRKGANNYHLLQQKIFADGRIAHNTQNQGILMFYC